MTSAYFFAYSSGPSRHSPSGRVAITWQALDNDAGQRFDSWVYRIAVNEALDLVRARRPSEALADDALDEQPGPEEAAVHDQDDALMQGALMQLKVEYRVVIVLKHLQGCAYEEIAGILECPVKTVKSRLFTARQALRDVLVAKGRL